MRCCRINDGLTVSSTKTANAMNRVHKQLLSFLQWNDNTCTPLLAPSS